MRKLTAAVLFAVLCCAQDVEVATTVAFTEGPTVDRDGNVYFTEATGRRIMKLTDGKLSVWRADSNGANGLVIDAQNRLIACESDRVTRTDLATGKIEILAQGGLQAPNDVTVDGNGRLYFTDMRGGAVYRIDAPGQFTKILAKPDIQTPNGIQVSPDDRTLYLVEANQAKDGARMIRAYDLQADGSVRKMRVHYNFYPGRSADGMSIDEQGNLYAAAGLNRTRGTSETLDTKAGIHVISPAGKLLRVIPVWEDLLTNCGFGGPDRKTLYITAGKTLFKVRVEIPGLPR
jgi:gluconolactonase